VGANWGGETEVMSRLLSHVRVEQGTQWNELPAASIPFNFFTRKLSQLQFELESAATNVEVMVTAAKQKGFDTMEFRREGAPAS